jgi:hypothetical protein
MKEAAVQNSAARSAAVNSPLNDSGRVDTLLSQREPNTERWGPAALDQRRERTRDHLPKIAVRRETGSTGTGTVMDCKPASSFSGGTAEKSSLSSPLMSGKADTVIGSGSWAHHPATDPLNP